MSNTPTELSDEAKQAIAVLRKEIAQGALGLQSSIVTAIGETPERDRAVIETLLRCITQLDRLMWNTWTTLSSNEPGTRVVELESIVRSFLAEEDRTEAEMVTEVERVRLLAAALIAAVGQCGPHFAQRHLARFAPERILAAVRLEKGLLGTIEAAAWRKYVQLAEDYDETAIESAIRESMATYIQSMIDAGGVAAFQSGDAAS